MKQAEKRSGRATSKWFERLSSASIRIKAGWQGSEDGGAKTVAVLSWADLRLRRLGNFGGAACFWCAQRWASDAFFWLVISGTIWEFEPRKAENRSEVEPQNTHNVMAILTSRETAML